MKTVTQLLSVVNKTTFSKDAGTTPERFKRILHDFSIATLGDFYRMSQVLDVDEKLIMMLFYNNYVEQRRNESNPDD